MQRLKEMATDVRLFSRGLQPGETADPLSVVQSLVDPKVKRKLLSVFHAWSLAFAVSTVWHWYPSSDL
jgi:hypothetical protein